MELISNSTDLLLCIVLECIETLLRKIRYSDLDDNVCVYANSSAEQAIKPQHDHVTLEYSRGTGAEASNVWGAFRAYGGPEVPCLESKNRRFRTSL